MALRGDIRAGDADRDAAVFRLREHYAAGRLSLAEFQQRLGRAYQARTTGDLARLTSDLPHDPPPPRGAAGPHGVAQTGARQYGAAQYDAGQPGTGQYGTGQYGTGQPGTGRGSAGPYSLAQASQAARESARRFARVATRFLLGLGAGTVALCVLVLLVSHFVFHSGLLAAALVVLVALAAAGTAVLAGLAWLTVRVWRRGAWLEALPLLAGQPWLGRALWAARVLWTGRTLWRLRGRLRLAPRA